jgi:membrane protease YdiL (CAAX protease family)
MPGLTHTHEPREFLIASVLLLCIAVPSLTDEVYGRLTFLRRTSADYAFLHVAVLMVLGFSGSLLLGIHWLPAARPGTPPGLVPAVWVAGGALAGVVAARSDRTIARTRFSPRRTQRSSFVATGQARPASPGLASLGLPKLLAVAGAEEFVYRGVLTSACFALPRPALSAGLALTTALFPLHHVRFGFRQALAKVPLSVVALACVLVSHSLLPAIIAHCVFNTDMWHEMRRRSGGGQVDLSSRDASALARRHLR